MIVPTYILLAIGLLGAADIHFFHTKAQRIREHAECRAELITHFVRGPLYAALFVLVPNFTFHGLAFAGLMVLLLFDFLTSVADFWLEPVSRASQGGLPRGEYLLHVLIAMLFGALVAATLYEGAPGWGEPTAIHWVTAGPLPAIRIAMAVMAPIALVSGILDLRAVLRLPREG